MQKITPFLWFDDNAEEAINFYTSIIPNSKTDKVTIYDDASAAASGRSAGSVMTVSFHLNGREFAAINGGPHFKFNPSISFFIVLESVAAVDKLWNELAKGGTVLMDLDKYEWSEKYGWIQDKYGLSWQVSVASGDGGQMITPSLLFVGEQNAKADEAIHFYTSVFKNSEITMLLHYKAGDPQPEGTVMYAQFKLNGESFIAMDGGLQHPFNFNEAVSFVINCTTQEEVDYYWEKLTMSGSEQPCGWLKDKFGVSWQVVPEALIRLLGDPNPEKSRRVMNSMLQMKKIIIADLESAYDEE